MYIANGAGDCSKEFHCPEVELQNAPYGKGLTSILRELLQNILENTIARSLKATKSWIQSLWWEKMIRSPWRSPSPGLSTNWIKIIKMTLIQSQFELQGLRSIPSADQIANVICRRKFRQFCQFFQNFSAKELILNSLTLFKRYIWAFFHYWNSFI